MTQLFDLSGKAALVTGGTRGIGHAIARQLAAHGARVAITGRDAARCRDTAEALGAAGRVVVGIQADMEKPEDISRLAAAAADAVGPLDILVLNAAIAAPVGPMARATPAAIDRIFAANVRSAIQLANLVLPGMAERRSGSIIVLGSISGLVGERSLGIYGLTKAAEMQLVRNIAVEYGRHNVRANAIAPGLIRTEMSQPLWSSPATLSRIAEAYPLRRIGEPDDIAGVAVFLASPASAFMTGQTLVVDGGGLIGQGTPI